jgi:hypothetical protein
MMNVFSKTRAKIARRTEQIKSFYSRYEKHAPVTAFAIGFLYDSLTLTRIDQWLDNAILLLYTLLAGALITIMGMVERGRIRHPFILKHLDFIANAIHFFLGGLLSSYVVFYFKSASVGKSFIFVCILTVLLLANEFFAHRLRNLKFLCAIYFFCCYAFLTFFLPVATHIMSQAMFLSSGLLSLIITGAIVTVVYNGGFKKFRREYIDIGWPQAVIYIAIVIFYFQNWIPPVPLALKDGGIYRSVKRVAENYELRYTSGSWWQFWKKDESNFAYAAGDTAYCFASVFAPTQLRERVYHHWQMKNAKGDWQTTDRLSYKIVGGRDGGYRGYSYKKNFSLNADQDKPQDWRIEVKTGHGLLLGRINFEVRPRDKDLPQLAITVR